MFSKIAMFVRNFWFVTLLRYRVRNQSKLLTSISVDLYRKKDLCFDANQALKVLSVIDPWLLNLPKDYMYPELEITGYCESAERLLKLIRDFTKMMEIQESPYYVKAVSRDWGTKNIPLTEWLTMGNGLLMSPAALHAQLIDALSDYIAAQDSLPNHLTFMYMTSFNRVIEDAVSAVTLLGILAVNDERI